jgi:hypothetical protein
MILKLTNAESELELPRDFKPQIGTYKKRMAFKPRYSQDGAEQTGDGRVGSRLITFRYMATSGDIGDLNDSTIASGTAEQQKDESYRKFIWDLIAFFRPEVSPVYLVDTDGKLGSGFRTEIAYLEHDDEPFADGTILRVGQNMFKAEMISGHWEDLEEQTDTQTSIGNEDSWTIDNSGPLDIYPVFSITALNQVETVTITNDRNGQFFTYSNTSFGVGSTLIVDGSGREFSCRLDNVETGFSLDVGSGPIQLAPGDNTLIFESPTGLANVTTTWRRRYP